MHLVVVGLAQGQGCIDLLVDLDGWLVMLSYHLLQGMWIWLCSCMSFCFFGSAGLFSFVTTHASETFCKSIIVGTCPLPFEEPLDYPEYHWDFGCA